MATVADADQPVLDRALNEVLGEGLPADIEVELRLPPSRKLRFGTISLRALSQDDGTINGAIACVADITDSARMREELKRRATFDELTGCYNRASIMGALEANIASGQRQAERAVVFVDLDGFKAVNDRYGHAAGDELLNVVAQRLQGVLRDEDMVGRIGGDEFLTVCPNVGGPDQAMRLAERLAQAQREEAPVATGSIAVQVSIGVACPVAKAPTPTRWSRKPTAPCMNQSAMESASPGSRTRPRSSRCHPYAGRHHPVDSCEPPSVMTAAPE